MDDFFETHDVDDLQEFGDREAFEDMQEELDPDDDWCDDCGWPLEDCICSEIEED